MRRPNRRRGGIGSISSSSLTEFDTSNGTGEAGTGGATFNDATNEYVSPTGTVTNYGGQVANQLTSSGGLPTGLTNMSSGGVSSLLQSLFGGAKAGSAGGAVNSTLGASMNWIPLAIAAVVVFALLRKK